MKLNKNKLILVIITLLVLAGLLLSGCAFADNVEATSKVYRVGLLSGADTFNSVFDSFKAKMEELGYKEGGNITYDFQASGGDAQKMQQIAEKFVADKVDLIVTTSNGGALAAQKATVGTGIPVVFTIVLAPVETAVVTDLRQPGANLTGVRNPLEDFAGKRVELLLQMAPQAKRIWVPYSPDYVTVNVVVDQLRKVAPALGVELIESPLDSPEALVADLESRAELDDIGFDAIIIMPDVVTVQTPVGWEAILAFAQKHDLPIAANTASQVEQGALFGYLSENTEVGQLAAPLADKILRGSNPGTIPVANSEPHLILNYKAAQVLNLKINDGLLAQAAQIIR